MKNLPSPHNCLTGRNCDGQPCGLRRTRQSQAPRFLPNGMLCVKQTSRNFDNPCWCCRSVAVNCCLSTFEPKFYSSVSHSRYPVLSHHHGYLRNCEKPLAPVCSACHTEPSGQQSWVHIPEEHGGECEPRSLKPSERIDLIQPYGIDC